MVLHVLDGAACDYNVATVDSVMQCDAAVEDGELYPRADDGMLARALAFCQPALQVLSTHLLGPTPAPILVSTRWWRPWLVQ
jgi:hypothetical protein